MPDLLDPADVETALAALPGWTFQDDALVKRADVPADSQDGLLESVAQVADELDHHPDVSRETDAVVFRLRTHSAGGVTSKDVDLAARIDQVLSGASRDTGTT